MCKFDAEILFFGQNGRIFNVAILQQLPLVGDV